MPFTRRMFIALQVEEAAITAASIYFLSQHNLGLSFWVWLLLFFTPDVSMLGYLAGPRVGAWTYNIFHHRAVALALCALGFVIESEIWISIGLLLFAHASFDRMLGYGLKYSDGFAYTSLGLIGKKKKEMMPES